MMLLYSLGLLLAVLLASPYWIIRMVAAGRYREGLGQRLGRVPEPLRTFLGTRKPIWVHAVSVGEVIAASHLIALLDAMKPKIPVVISTTTATGQKMARERFGEARVFYFPLDFGWAVRRYLRAVRPRMLVLMESELWPRMLVEAHRRGVPVVVVNGRVSDRSLPRYRRLHWLWRPLLSRVTRVLAQSDQDRERFISIGVPAKRAETGGNLKYDVRAASDLRITAEVRRQLAAGMRVLVAGSTLVGEEELLLDAFRGLQEEFPQLMMVVAPRHPERFDQVEELTRRKGMKLVRRSEWGRKPWPITPGTVFLLDTIGELASVYSLASVAVVGGSLVPAGGHNPLEPAQFGVPILMGPYTENFRGIVGVLLAREAIRVTPPERLEFVLRELLEGSGEMGERAKEVSAENAGASKTCAEAIRGILKEHARAGVSQ